MRSSIFLILALTLVSGCAGDGSSADLTIGVAGLEDLGADFVYEGWLVVDGTPVSAGRFAIDGDGNAIPDTFTIDAEVAADATAYVLTIEPAVGDDPAPSDVHVLAGDFIGVTAALDTSHAAAIGTDFSAATGEYILETPSSGAVVDDYDQGIWWLVPGSPAPSPGLSLPTLPAGWVYEGWVVGAGGPISTGTFSAVDQADSDAAGAAGGADATPPFPGQDFIDPPEVLTGGYAAVISVEPVPDNSPAPFVIKPLMDGDITSVMAPATQTMMNIAADTIPSGTAALAL